MATAPRPDRGHAINARRDRLFRETKADRVRIDHQVDIVRALAGVLRIAIGLDRTQDGRVKKLETTLLSDALEITFKTTKSQDTDLNAYAANERRTLLSDVLGRRVKVSAR
jgi:hypothetical protein